jgi:hypothetical protein
VPEHVAVSERLQALLEAHSYALVRAGARDCRCSRGVA